MQRNNALSSCVNLMCVLCAREPVCVCSVRDEDVQPQGASPGHGLGGGLGLLDSARQGHGHQECVVDSIVRAQFVAESRWWFDRAEEEEEELQHFLADEILDTLLGETVGVLDKLQARRRNVQRAAAVPTVPTAMVANAAQLVTKEDSEGIRSCQ
jgi:hypothetical protein